MKYRWGYHSPIAGTMRYDLFREFFIAGLILVIVRPFISGKFDFTAFGWVAAGAILVALGCVVYDMILSRKKGDRKNIDSWIEIVCLVLLLILNFNLSNLGFPLAR